MMIFFCFVSCGVDKNFGRINKGRDLNNYNNKQKERVWGDRKCSVCNCVAHNSRAPKPPPHADQLPRRSHIHKKILKDTQTREQKKTRARMEVRTLIPSFTDNRDKMHSKIGIEGYQETLEASKKTHISHHTSRQTEHTHVCFFVVCMMVAMCVL